MYRRILIGGVTAAAIVGAGGAALAATGSDSTNSAGSSSHQSATARSHDGKKGRQGKRMKGRRLLRRVDHGQFVVHTRKGFVTVQLIRGTVTDVSASSITVTSADHVTDTFAVTPDTKVHKRVDGKPAASTIGAVAKGDHVVVGGTGATNPSARRVFDRGTK